MRPLLRGAWCSGRKRGQNQWPGSSSSAAGECVVLVCVWRRCVCGVAVCVASLCALAGAGRVGSVSASQPEPSPWRPERVPCRCSPSTSTALPHSPRRWPGLQAAGVRVTPAGSERGGAWPGVVRPAEVLEHSAGGPGSPLRTAVSAARGPLWPQDWGAGGCSRRRRAPRYWVLFSRLRPVAGKGVCELVTLEAC